MKHQIKQRGFTLIELLVVVAIMGTLLGLVAISNRPSRKTQLRMAAQSVASLVVAAQSTALDSEVGSALWISSDGVYDANPQQNESLVLHTLPNGTPSTTCLLALRDDSGAAKQKPADAFRVRFVSTATDSQPPSPWFSLNGASARFMGPQQTLYNTIWPARFYSNPSSPNCSAEFDLYPQQTGLAYQWPRFARIDWRYSGIGGNAPLAADAVLVFDGGGKIESYFTNTTQLIGFDHAMSTLYLCIAYAPDVDAGAATLSNEDTVWVAIEPSTTRATLAWNVPTALSDPNSPTSAELLAARANVIAGKGLAD
jgi:prepilin-type N-terminal cleavage/methylation domain-containing protein